MSSDFLHGVLWTLGVQLAGAIILSLLVRETWRYFLGWTVEKMGSSLWRRIKGLGKIKP